MNNKSIIIITIRILAIELIALAIFLFPHISNLTYKSDITDFFDPTDIQVSNFHSVNSKFNLSESPTLLIQSQEKDIISNKVILSLYQYTQQIESLGIVKSTYSILDTPMSSDNQPLMSVKEFIKNGHTFDDDTLGQLADNIATSAYSVSVPNQLFSIKMELKNNDNYSELSNFIRTNRNYTFPIQYLVGPQAIKEALHSALSHDLFLLAPIILFFGILALWYFLHSWWLIFVATSTIVTTLLITLGITGSLGTQINQTSSLAYAIAFIISLANIIHLLTSYKRYLKTSHNLDAVLQSLHTNAGALLLTSITTCIGFLSLNFSDSPVFATFGNIAAIGVTCAYFSAISMTSSLLLLNRKATNKLIKPHLPLQFLASQALKLGNGLPTRYRKFFYSFCLAIGSGIFLLSTHNDPIDYFPESFSIKQASQVSNNAFGIHHPIFVEIDSTFEEGILKPSYLKTVSHFKSWADAHPLINDTYDFNDNFGLIQAPLREHNLKWQSPPTALQDFIDLLNLYQMSHGSNTFDQLKVDKELQRTLVTLAVGKLKNDELNQLQSEIVYWFMRHAPEYKVSVTGHGVLFSEIGRSLTSNMLWGGLFSVIIISLLMGVFLNNIRIAVIAIIPNILPTAVVFGLYGWIVGYVDLAAAGTLSISIGIVVDDSIHILKHYIYFRKQGHSPDHCASLTLRQVGSALILTTIVLSAGMGILMFSTFGPNQTTAIFLTSIIVIALLFDLIILPHLLKVFDGWLFSSTPYKQHADQIESANTVAQQS